MFKKNSPNAFYKKYSFCLLIPIVLASCTGHKSGQETDKSSEEAANSMEWKGDNPADFKAEGLSVSTAGAGIYPRVPYKDRKVGMAYTTWAREGFWNPDGIWAFPTLGKYRSDDRSIIRKHAEWLADAGVDFIWIDWSNDVNYYTTMDKVITDSERPDFSMIERSTLYIFEEYSKMRAEGKKTPKISIFIGNPGEGQASAVSDGRLTKKADQVDQWFLNNKAHPEFKDLIQEHNGKPLLVSYTGTPSPWYNETPPWNDDRFTVRFMTGFITQQPGLFNADTKESKFKYWSWEDRGAQTFTVDNGSPESMVVVASWRPQGKAGEKDYIAAGQRNDGKTFKEQWARARLIGVQFAMVGTWNEYTTAEQISKEVSKDIEPNSVWGDKYLVLLKEEIKRFKGNQ